MYKEELNIYNIEVSGNMYYLYPLSKLPAKHVLAMMNNPSPDNFMQMLLKASFVEDTKRKIHEITFEDLMELSEKYMTIYNKEVEAKESEKKEKEGKSWGWFKRLD